MATALLTVLKAVVATAIAEIGSTIGLTPS